MAGVVRKTDSDSKGYVNGTSATNVYVERIPLVGFCHVRPCDECTGSNIGRRQSYVGRAFIQIMGDSVSCGCCQVQGSSTVFCDGV